MLQDAAKALCNYFQIDVEELDEADPGQLQLAADTLGFGLDEAINDSSEFYMLPRLVDEYSEHQDQNVAAATTWRSVIAEAIDDN